jgi:hypothetical protein
MKLARDEFDPKALAEVEVEERRFERYDGEVPNTGTIVKSRITKAWVTTSGDGTFMIVVVTVAEQNKGDRKQFNGLPTWDYLVFKETGAFRYMPFLENFGITTYDIFNKLDVEEADDNIGTPIIKIGKWRPGSDDALSRVVIKKDRYEGSWRSKVDVDGWLPFDADADADDDEDEDEEETATVRTRRPAARAASNGTASRSRRAAAVAEPDEDDDDDEYEDDEEDDDYDEDEEAEAEDDEDEEEAEEEAPPARTRRAPARGRASTSAPARTTRAASSSRRAEPAARSGRGGAGGRTATVASRSTRRSGRDAATEGYNDEPPF